MFRAIDESDTDSNEAMSLETVAKFKGFKVPKGTMAISLAIMSERISNEKPGDPEPKKALNRVTYRAIKLALGSDDPKIVLDIWKEIQDRVDGKATQAIEHSGTMTLTHEEALKALS